MDKTIDMAREVKMPYDFVTGEPIYIEKLKAFEALVRADEREKYEAIVASMTKLLEAQQKRENVAIDMIAAGAAAEREACAKVCSEWSDYTKGIAPTLAERIRARGNI